MKKKSIQTVLIIALAVLLAACSSPSPSGPVRTNIEGVYGGLIYSLNVPIFAMIAKIKPLYDGEFIGEACMDDFSSTNSMTCHLISDGMLQGSDISFRIGGVEFYGKKLPGALDLVLDAGAYTGTAYLELNEDL